jgi:hypothetical protein
METNSQKVKDEIELDIKGDEKLEPPIGKFGQVILGIWFVLWGILALASLFSKKGDFIGAIVIGGVVFLIIAAFMKFLQMLTPSYWKYLEKSKNIKKYFEKRFDIVQEFNPSLHTKLDAMRIESSEDYERILFDIYMIAYNLDADAIVLQKLERERAGAKHNMQVTIIKYNTNHSEAQLNDNK